MNKHKMSKKLLATIMTFAMLITMFPSGVFAQDSGNGYQNGEIVSGTVTNSANGVTVNKYVTQDENGNYNLTLEGYASNKLTTTSTSTPLDIVLVLDVSGSMKDPIGTESVEYRPVEKESWTKNDIDDKRAPQYYYLADDGKYYEVYVADEGHGWNSVYSLRYRTEDWWTSYQVPGSETSRSDRGRLYTGTLYVKHSSVDNTLRIDALKESVNTFIDSVKKNAENKDVAHQISIVKFAGDKTSAIGNDKYWNGSILGSDHYNYSQIVSNLTDVRGNGAESLKDAVEALDPSGATQADYGMEKASEALQSARPNAKKVVVMFTDGDPTSGNQFEESVANAAISEAKTLKEDTTIYTVGIFNGANPDGKSNSNKYMNGVSSNYPDASSYQKLGDRVSDDKDYYFAADDAESLTNVFEGIAEDVTTGDLEVNPDADATLEDTLSQYFDLPAGITKDRVKVKYVEATGYDPEKGFTFADKASALPEGTDIHVDIDEENENIKVSGFDYKAHAASYEKQDDGTYKVSGGKLVVTFPIEVDENACLLEPIKSGLYPTNDTDDSKAKLAYKANEQAEDNNAVTALNESPKVYFDNTKFDANGTDVTVQVYLDGEKVDPDEYVTLTRKTGQNDNWTYFNRVDKSDNVLTYDFNYNPDPESGFNCVDINVALNKDDVVLQGVHSYQSHGKDGTNNVTPENGTYTVDNIASDGKDETVDCTIYLRTKYSAEYYVGDQKQGGDLTDNTVYLEKYDVAKPTDKADYPAERGDAEWMDWMNESYKTSITLKELPTVSGSVVDGWYLGDDKEKAESPVSVVDNKEKAEDNIFKFNATTAKLYNITINYVDDKNNKLKDSTSINDVKNGTEKTFDVSADTSGYIPKIIKKGNDQYVFNRLTEGNWTVKIEGANAAITAEYLLDSDKDGTPNAYEATVTYKVENGTWTEGGSDPITDEFILATWDEETNTWVKQPKKLGDGEHKVPTGMKPDATHVADGAQWYKGDEAVKIDNNTAVAAGSVTYIYKFLTDKKPGLTVTKTVASVGSTDVTKEQNEKNEVPNAKVGQDIIYKIVVTNSGNTTLQNINVTDTLKAKGEENGTAIEKFYSDEECTKEASAIIANLEKGKNATLYVKHHVTENDMGKTLINNAVATSGDTTGNDDSPEVDVTVEYKLIYDANGGKYADEEVSGVAFNEYLTEATESGKADKEECTLKNDKDLGLSHAKTAEDVKVIFDGWTTTDTNGKVYAQNEGDSVPKAVESVTINGKDARVYAIWAEDANGNDVPDYEEDLYTLTYDPTSGKLGSGGKTAEVANLMGDKTYTLWTEDNQGTKPDSETAWPTHDVDKDGNAIIMIGWAQKDPEKIYDVNDEDPSLIPEVKLTENTTVYAVWGYDKNGNGEPDVYETPYDLTYHANGGTFGDTENKEATVPDLLPNKEGETYPLWAQNDEGFTGTYPKDTAWPKHANVGDDAVVLIGWTAKADTTIYDKSNADKMPNVIDNIAIVDKNEDVYALWGYDRNGNGKPDVDEDQYTLTYHSTSGYFGSADKKEAVASGLLAKDYKLWTKVNDTTFDGEAPDQVDGKDVVWPTHDQAPAPEGSVIVEKGEMVDVEFIGWSTDDPGDKIYTAGEKYPTIKTSVTIPPSETEKDEDVYAVWGYDENDDGIADAQQIVIVPADITIYQGGNGYDGVLTDLDDGIADGDNEQATTNDNGLPEPGYYFILPYELNDYLGGAGNVIDLSGKLQLDYVNQQNADDKRGWTLELYNPDASPEDNMAYGKYVYRLVPQQDIPVRLEINAPLLDENGNKQYDDEGNVLMHFVSSDNFTVRLNSLFQEFSMKLWTDPEVDRTQVTAQVQDKDNNNEWTDANEVLEGENSVQGIARGTAKLTVRGTTNEDVVTPVQDAAPESLTGITAVGNEKNEYVTNESNIPVVPNEDENNVALLADSIVSESETAQALKSAVTGNEAHGISSDYTFDFSYLDLVDTNNGNAYLTLSNEKEMSVDLYWPKPDDMAEGSDVYIVHYDGLDRDFDASNLDANYVTDNADIKVYSTDATDPALKLEDTGNGYKITTSTFSPFAIVYKQAEEPSVTPDPGPGGGGDPDRPGLNLEDHYSYIVGYPEDYRTGEATDDESLWPVKPQGKITRAEVATIFYRLLNNETRTENWTTSNNFTDVDADDWYNTPISTLSSMGIIVGYNDGSFQPNAPITRAEFAAIAVRFYQNNDVNYEEGLFTDIDGSEWFADAIAAAYEHGIIGGYVDGSFQPNNQITRAEAAAIVNRTTDRFPDKDHLLDAAEMRTWPDNADPDAWYYADIQEATNSHEYYKMDDPDGEEGDQIEQWTERGEDVDWDAVEAYQESVH